MENLFKIKTFLVLFIVVFGLNNLFSQNDLFVFKITGEPYIEVNDSIRSVTKGTIINKSTTLFMNREDIVHFINEKGDVFELYSTGKFSHKELLKTPEIKSTSSFTKKYFTYLWKEFTNNIALRNNKSGVVYRGPEDLLMQHPPKNSEVYASELSFNWKPIENKEKNYYFFLREIESENYISIGTLDTTLSLVVDGNYIKHDTSYEWTISETRFPNFNKITFHSFKTASKEDFQNRKEEIIAISKDLKSIGIESNNVKHIICSDYKLCY